MSCSVGCLPPPRHAEKLLFRYGSRSNAHDGLRALARLLGMRPFTFMLGIHIVSLFFKFIIFILIFVMSAGSVAAATVVDDFRMLPEDVIAPIPGLDVKNWMLDENRGSIIDIKNGYILAYGDGGQATLSISKWSDPDVVVVSTLQNDIYGPQFYSFAHKDSRLVKIRMAWEKEGHQYLLPQYGKDIVEYDLTNNITAVIKLIKGKFVRIDIP